MFLTGSDRIPILGMKSLKLVIQPTGGGEHYLPVAHTCFNLLDLPKYTSIETLREKLLQAIDHNQGFNLAWTLKCSDDCAVGDHHIPRLILQF